MAKPLRYVYDDSDLRKYADDFEKSVVHRVLELVSFALAGNVKMEAPVDHGFLRGSVEEPIVLRLLEFGINIGANYWEYLQFGTGIHGPKKKTYNIEPSDKKALKFKSRGKTVIVRRIIGHPGMKPNPFITRGIERTEPMVEGIVAQVLREVD